MQLSENAKATLLICTRLALPKEPQYEPYGTAKWNKLVEAIVSSPLKEPAALLEVDHKQITEQLSLNDDEANRLTFLISRGGALAMELERLETMGIWVLTRSDPEYPTRYIERLHEKRPAVLFGCGDQYLPNQPGIAIVGSRDIDEAGTKFAEKVGNAAAHRGLIVFSGGARGVDQIAMKNALNGRGFSVGILANSLVSQIKSPEYRNAIREGNLTLITPYAPEAGFSAGNAMGRNKLIYCLADYGLVVSSSSGKGGTWNGAQEVIKNRWVPLFVRNGPDVPIGNKKLIEQGCLPFPDSFSDWENLNSWFDEEKKKWDQQMTLF